MLISHIVIFFKKKYKNKVHFYKNPKFLLLSSLKIPNIYNAPMKLNDKHIIIRNHDLVIILHHIKRIFDLIH